MAHFYISMNVGVAPEQLQELIVVLQNKVGQPEADTASKILADVLNK